LIGVGVDALCMNDLLIDHRPLICNVGKDAKC
jgi:hypothetical protein